MVRPHLVKEEDAPTPEDIEWTRATLETLKRGGVWVVPRSGVAVMKHGDTEYTVGYMPFWDKLGVSAKGVVADANLIAKHIFACGYTVKVEAFPDEEPNAD